MKHPANRSERRHERERVVCHRRAIRVCHSHWREQIWSQYSKWNGNCGSTLCHSGKYFGEKRRRRRALLKSGLEDMDFEA
jgi:hypothetical protein